MENKFKITVPKPCHEDWNAMIPSDRGRFCNACTTQVVDFTNMSTDEIRDYLNKNTNVCGRFKNEQLESVIIQIPKSVLFSQVHFHKMFMLALLISMGTSLFSCQNSNGTKQKIETVEVVEEQRPTVGIVMPSKDSVEIKIDTNFVYKQTQLDVRPTFKGGDISSFRKYFVSNFEIPKKYNNLPFFIYVEFIIEIDGSLSEIKITRNTLNDLDLDVIKVIKSSPKWSSGEISGVKVRSSYAFPIHLEP